VKSALRQSGAAQSGRRVSFNLDKASESVKEQFACIAFESATVQADPQNFKKEESLVDDMPEQQLDKGSAKVAMPVQNSSTKRSWKEEFDRLYEIEKQKAIQQVTEVSELKIRFTVSRAMEEEVQKQIRNGIGETMQSFDKMSADYNDAKKRLQTWRHTS